MVDTAKAASQPSAESPAAPSAESPAAPVAESPAAPVAERSASAGSPGRAVHRRAAEAFAQGRTRPLEWRRQQLEGIERLLNESEEELLTAMADDFGKPRVEAWMGDLALTRTEASVARRKVHRWARPRTVWPGLPNLPGRAWVVPEPKGVVLILSPWNYPVQLALAPLVAAVAAGNAAVLKPSELTPATSAALARLVPRYVDNEAVAVVEGGVEAATDLLDQPFDHVFFTGSTAVGRQVMKAAAEHLASVTLELGGKSPAIVADDADIEVTARRIGWGKLFNAGQTCIAPDYALVTRGTVDRFVDALGRSFEELQGDDPHRTRTRIVNGRHLERLEGLLKSSGGTVVRGGSLDREDRWFEPTIVVDPDLDAPLMQDEIFGPILPIVTVDSVDEAVGFVRQRPKPLALYLFTRSRQVEDRVLQGTSSGGVCINHVSVHVSVPDLPFGGVGPSGTGAYHGRAGFDELSHARPVLRRRPRPDPSIAYPPYDERKERWIRRLV